MVTFPSLNAVSKDRSEKGFSLSYRPMEESSSHESRGGIAMGAAGTDTAIETADIALMKDDLNKVAEAVHLGRQTLRIIRTNIIFALAIKAVFLVLALFGYTSLWLAILADTGATLLVILNSKVTPLV
jgi:cation transport ATPase